ncbi:enoyl-CoA hydratase [Bradymonadaceae bacterium TMQ3]|uniref:Enoyl-CoA hydratase n=1 Tax=Lujinxingia sediminis TaxID=2480984 RepID=A0ABY0CSK1_9DELT|nr:enoyl-CoA hydratase-related protein [Lujinxingia sediminis]RDV38305.1 enoyl-CoA hydratase [Bradymonadaceae bacterium TMQ3]RVU43492.1 enoyl-CoA hydratase [Lujinxingia sediminis]TXC75979.1 enoyl-CoA hydratase [Bradymonadales bacterium TMQ1]
MGSTNLAYDVLKREQDAHGICTLTIDRPDAMNALNGELVDALWETFYALRHDDSVRVVILTATGRAFCAGADLAERRTMSEAQVRKRIDDYHQCFNAVAELPKPTICAINGYAFGGGLELALACDLRLVDEATKIGLTELRLGIIPGAGGTQRLTRLVGAARAKELIFTARRLSGTEAKAYGLVNDAVPGDQLLERAGEIAGEMLLSAPIALKQAKLAIDTGAQVDLHSGLALESAAYAVTLPTEDRLEGLAAFQEKRAPKFKGK